MLPINEILGKINPKEKTTRLSQEEFYLSLVIGERKVQAGIWNFSKEGGRGLAYGSVESWGGENAEELIVASDTSIASSVAALPEVAGSQPTKVVLGLPDSWVEGSAVKKEKLDILQTICKKLLLKPLGFVVTPEAIAHLLKRREGGLPSVIIVSLDEAEIAVSLIVQGKFLGSKLVGRSNSLAMDVEEGLLRFNFSGDLPSRIMILDGKDLEEEKQSLISYPWIAPDNEKKLGFLQLPKVEAAEENFEISAVVFAGSKEIGQETMPEPLPKETEKITKETLQPEEEKIIESAFPETDFGFVKGKDILTVNPPQETSTEPLEVEFPEQPEKLKTEVLATEVKVSSPKPFRPQKFNLLVVLGKIVSPFRKLLKFFLRRVFLVLLVLVIVFFGGIFLAFKTTAKAEVKLFVRPQKIEKEFEFTVSPKVDSVDKEKMIIPAKEISAEVSGKKSADVTGKKTVGEKAKGEIIIYNRTDQVKSLPKGLVLKGPASLKFLLDEEVKVASKTADLEKGVDKWGEAKAKLTAENIGTQYNLAADSVLSFDTISSSLLVVKLSAAFSGGSSREIQAVSKEDRDNLQKALYKELEGTAKEQVKSKISPSDYLLEDAIQLKSKTDRFGREVGDEAASINLEEKAVFSALFFKEEDLKILVGKVVSSTIGEGYQHEAVKEEKSVIVKDKNKGIYLVKIKQDFLPNIKTEEVVQELKSKSFAKAEAFLKGLDQVVGVDISVQPKIFLKLKFFPLDGKNISVKVEAI